MIYDFIQIFGFYFFMIGCAPLCAPLCAPMGHMGHMLYCAPLFINGDIDTDVVDTDAYSEDNDDDYV